MNMKSKNYLYVFLLFIQKLFFCNVDCAMQYIYSHKYNTNSAEDSSDIIKSITYM